MQLPLLLAAFSLVQSGFSYSLLNTSEPVLYLHNFRYGPPADHFPWPTDLDLQQGPAVQDQAASYQENAAPETVKVLNPIKEIKNVPSTNLTLVKVCRHPGKCRNRSNLPLSTNVPVVNQDQIESLYPVPSYYNIDEDHVSEESSVKPVKVPFKFGAKMKANVRQEAAAAPVRKQETYADIWATSAMNAYGPTTTTTTTTTTTEKPATTAVTTTTTVPTTTVPRYTTTEYRTTTSTTEAPTTQYNPPTTQKTKRRRKKPSTTTTTTTTSTTTSPTTVTYTFPTESTTTATAAYTPRYTTTVTPSMATEASTTTSAYTSSTPQMVSSWIATYYTAASSSEETTTETTTTTTTTQVPILSTEPVTVRFLPSVRRSRPVFRIKTEPTTETPRIRRPSLYRPVNQKSEASHSGRLSTPKLSLQGQESNEHRVYVAPGTPLKRPSAVINKPRGQQKFVENWQPVVSPASLKSNKERQRFAHTTSLPVTTASPPYPYLRTNASRNIDQEAPALIRNMNFPFKGKATSVEAAREKISATTIRPLFKKFQHLASRTATKEVQPPVEESTTTVQRATESEVVKTNFPRRKFTPRYSTTTVAALPQHSETADETETEKSQGFAATSATTVKPEAQKHLNRKWKPRTTTTKVIEEVTQATTAGAYVEDFASVENAANHVKESEDEKQEADVTTPGRKGWRPRNKAAAAATTTTATTTTTEKSEVRNMKHLQQYFIGASTTTTRKPWRPKHYPAKTETTTKVAEEYYEEEEDFTTYPTTSSTYTSAEIPSTTATTTTTTDRETTVEKTWSTAEVAEITVASEVVAEPFDYATSDATSEFSTASTTTTTIPSTYTTATIISADTVPVTASTTAIPATASTTAVPTTASTATSATTTTQAPSTSPYASPLPSLETTETVGTTAEPSEDVAVTYPTTHFSEATETGETTTMVDSSEDISTTDGQFVTDVTTPEATEATTENVHVSNNPTEPESSYPITYALLHGHNHNLKQNSSSQVRISKSYSEKHVQTAQPQQQHLWYFDGAEQLAGASSNGVEIVEITEDKSSKTTTTASTTTPYPGLPYLLQAAPTVRYPKNLVLSDNYATIKFGM